MNMRHCVLRLSYSQKLTPVLAQTYRHTIMISKHIKLVAVFDDLLHLMSIRGSVVSEVNLPHSSDHVLGHVLVQVEDALWGSDCYEVQRLTEPLEAPW